MNSNNQIGNNAAILTISKIITSLTALASGMLLSRFRSLEEYGTFSEMMIVINLSTTLFIMGLPSSINFFIAQSKTQEEKSLFISTYYTLCTFLCFIMGGALAVSTPLIVKYFKNASITSFVYVLVLLPWSKVIIGSMANILVVFNKTIKLAVYNITNALVSLIAILLVRFNKGSFNIYMLLYLLGEIGMMFWAYCIVWKLGKPLSIKIDKKLVLSILKYSIPIGMASLVGTLMNETDKLIIGKMLNTESLAVYTNAARELPFTILAVSLTTVLLPQMVRCIKDGNNKQAIDLWGKTIEISFVFMSFVVTALFVFAPQIMTILYSEKYLPGVNVFRVYSLILLVRITSFGMILNASGHTRFILFNSILSMIANIVFDYVFFKLLGFIGPAIATMLTHFLGVFFYLFTSSRVVNINVSNIFPWKKVLKHSAINLAWGVPTFLAINILSIGTSTLEIVVCICVGIIITLIYSFFEKKTVVSLWKDLNNVN